MRLYRSSTYHYAKSSWTVKYGREYFIRSYLNFVSMDGFICEDCNIPIKRKDSLLILVEIFSNLEI